MLTRSKISFISTLLAAILALPVVVPTPPSFVHVPNPDELFFRTTQDLDSFGWRNDIPDDDIFDLSVGHFRCAAKGSPAPIYTWFKNGEEFPLNNTDRIVKTANGSFVLKHLVSADAGEYVCHAKNDHGSAVDKPVTFTEAYFGEPSEKMDLKQIVPVKKMTPYKRECRHTNSVPPADIFWIYKTGQANFKSINDTAISMVSTGPGQSTIFYSYVADPKPGLTCVAHNAVLGEYKFYKVFQLQVTDPDAARRHISPEFLYKSPALTIAKEGDLVELHCIPKGYPVPNVQWQFNGKDVAKDAKKKNFGKTLVLSNVSIKDLGNYRCKFDIGGRWHQMMVVVQ